ncbi:MAG: ubiquinol-cytochrome c reductase iron-sulfur subunit [Gammaproteobacteria bacterium]|nr:ubiquinol-cytochrome c reductase iron-sulfur subunit [Gammaproteobacteria bacterium]
MVTLDDSQGEPDWRRRRFLVATTSVVGAAAVAAVAGVMVDSLEPTAADTAAASTTVNLEPIEPGMQVTVPWQKKPVVVVNRTPAMLATLKETAAKGLLKDADCSVPQQPPYCKNEYRARKPEWLVMVRICTHLCCIPHYRPKKASVTPWWLGGFHCPCHGSMYDLSGRVIKGSPAPHNMAVPEYHYAKDGKTVTITKMYPEAHLC